MGDTGGAAAGPSQAPRRKRPARPSGWTPRERWQLLIGASYVGVTAALEKLSGSRGVPFSVAFSASPGDLFTAAHVATAHNVIACISGVMLFLSLTIWCFTGQPKKRSACSGVSLANFMHFVTYASMASGWLSALLSGSGVPNEYVCPHRYLLWLASTLMLITILGDLVPPSPEKTAALGATLGADVAMMLLGAAEHALPNPWRALFLAASGAAFVPVVRGQMTLLGLAAEAMEEEDAAPLTFMRTTMLATWSTYPVLRLAAHAGLVGVNTQECVNCVFDILTKMGYTTVLMVGAFEQADLVARAHPE